MAADETYSKCGAAADDHAERDHRVGTGLEGGLRDDGQLEAARHAHELVCGTGCLEGAGRTGDQAVRDLVVPAAGDDHDPEAGAVDVEWGSAPLMMRVLPGVSAAASVSCWSSAHAARLVSR